MVAVHTARGRACAQTAVDARPMPDDRKLKKQLLRGAVADNLGDGTTPRTVAPAGSSQRPRRLPAMVGILAVIALAAASAAFFKRPPAPKVIAAAPTPATTPATRPQHEVPELRFARPTPINKDVLPLAVRRVVIDPGHGGDDWGTATGDGPDDLIEKHLTLDIGQRLATRLRAAGFEVLMTREEDRPLPLIERTTFANQQQADVFVSIHVNWFGAHYVRGVETYYLGATEDPELNAFARRENQDSGYSLADMRSLLEGIYADVRQGESRRLATRVQRALHRSLLPENPQLKDRGVKTAPFVVLVTTEMPAILAEVSCLSNREEVKRLGRPRYREHIAEALMRGIEAYAKDVNQTVEKGS